MTQRSIKLRGNSAGKIQRLNDNLSRSIEDSQKLLKAAIRDLEKNIISTMADLKAGRYKGILGTSTGLRRAQMVHKDLVGYFEDYYGKGARRAVKGYNRVASDIQKYWLGKRSIKYTKFDKNIIEVLATQSLEEFTQFGDLAREQIAKAMYTHVVSGAPFGNLVKETEAILGTGVDARGNNMARYAELWANDGIMNFHQAVSLKKADDAGIKRFLYQGGIIKTSRPFCKVRAGNIYTKREISRWNKMNWKGKRGPALIYRGGWNCRHHWVPIEDDQYVDAGTDE